MDLTSNKSSVEEALRALRDSIEESSSSKKISKNIFDEDESPRSEVCIVVALFKIPKIPKNGVVTPFHMKMPIPHSFVDDSTDVLLITKDLPKHKGLRKDHEPSLHHYKNILRDHNALDLVTEVMPLKQLRTEYREYESKRALFTRFDIVLADKAIVNRLGLFLGKEFYKRKKLPIGVFLGSKEQKALNIRTVLQNALSKVYMHMNLKGACSTAQIGRLDQSDEELSENLIACFNFVKEHIPGGWKNIRSIHLKTKKSPSVPLYVSMKSPNEVPSCPHPNPVKPMEPVVDTIDTVYGEKIAKVYPDGTVKIEGLTKLQEKRLDKNYRLSQEKKLEQNEKTRVAEKIWKNKAASFTKAKLNSKKKGKKKRKKGIKV